MLFSVEFPYLKSNQNLSPTTSNKIEPDKKSPDSTSMTIITTISITAVCIAAILVISALLILKLRKPVLSPIKVEEIKSCNENCSRTFIEQNNSQSYPQYQFVRSEDHDHTVSVVVWSCATCTCGDQLHVVARPVVPSSVARAWWGVFTNFCKSGTF